MDQTIPGIGRQGVAAQSEAMDGVDVLSFESKPQGA
jgi:hypothetical protein